MFQVLFHHFRKGIKRPSATFSSTAELQCVTAFLNGWKPCCLRPARGRKSCSSGGNWSHCVHVQPETEPHVMNCSRGGGNIVFSTSHTLIFCWLQVLWLSGALPVQVSQHEYGDIVVLLLQSDAVQHWRKADTNQTHPCFLQHLSASALLPRLPLNDISVTSTGSHHIQGFHQFTCLGRSRGLDIEECNYITTQPLLSLKWRLSCWLRPNCI